MKKLISGLLITSAMICTTISFIASAQENTHLVSVENAKVELVSPTMWLPGNVISRNNTPISAEQTGQLLWVVDVGTEIEKNQLIATIDNRHLKLQLAMQQAQVKQHQADVIYLTKQQTRLSTLNQKNNTSVSELESVVKDLAIAKNEVLALELMVQQTELAIEKTQITAPFDGHITQRFVNQGELISVGRPLVQLVDTKHLDIKVAAPLSIAQYLQADVQVMVKWQNKLVELPIRTWSQAGDQSTRTFDVRLSADGLNLFAGSAVTVSLPKQSEQLATLVPRDAIVLRERETFIMAVDKELSAKKVNVMIGQGVGRWIAVTGNITAGNEVIVRGGERLQTGQKVRIDEKLVAKLD